MKSAELPRGWWGYFDCEKCGEQKPAETLSDAYRLAAEHQCRARKVIPLRRP